MIVKALIYATAAFGALGFGAARGEESGGFIPSADYAAYAALAPAIPPVDCESGVPAPFRSCPAGTAPVQRTAAGPAEPERDRLLRQLAAEVRTDLLRSESMTVARRAPSPAESTGTVPRDPAQDALLRGLADRARTELLRTGPAAP